MAREDYRLFASEVRDIASRIGPARPPESIRTELEALANKYEKWGREPVSRPCEVCGGLTCLSDPTGDAVCSSCQ